jgi:hypothetical protein
LCDGSQRNTEAPGLGSGLALAFICRREFLFRVSSSRSAELQFSRDRIDIDVAFFKVINTVKPYLIANLNYEATICNGTTSPQFFAPSRTDSQRPVRGSCPIAATTKTTFDSLPAVPFTPCGTPFVPSAYHTAFDTTFFGTCTTCNEFTIPCIDIVSSIGPKDLSFGSTRHSRI